MSAPKPVCTTLDFPIPYRNQQPDTDVFIVLQRFDLLARIFDGASLRGMSAEMSQTIYDMMSEFRALLEPVYELLLELDDPEITRKYQDARRKVILRSFECGSAEAAE